MLAHCVTSVNNTTGGFAATLNGQTIPAGQAVEFFYSTVSSATGYRASGVIGADNGLTLGYNTASYVGLGGTLSRATTLNVSYSNPLIISASTTDGSSLRLVNATTTAAVGQNAILGFNPNLTSGLYPIGIGAEYVNAASNQGSADFVVKTSSGGSAATKFVVQNGGNVGIGTTNPQSLLQVIGDIKSGQATSGSIALSTGSGSQSGYLTIYKSDGTTSLGYIGYDNSNLLYAARNSSNHIFNGGNVGIYTGTSVPAQAPAQTLTVAGTMSATGATTLASTLAVTDRATFSNGVTVGSTSQPTMTITSTSSALNGAPANASGTFYYEATGTETHMFGGNVVPDADGSRSLGMSGVRWGTIYSSNSTINTSDSRLKTNIENSVYGLQAVLRMRPVTYNWKKEPTTNHMVGFIAQEMEQIVPEAVEAPRTAGEYYGMKYTELIPVLTKAIQEQQAQIEALKVANSELQAQASELRDVKASLQSLAEQVQLLQANGSTATTK